MEEASIKFEVEFKPSLSMRELSDTLLHDFDVLPSEDGVCVMKRHPDDKCDFLEVMSAWRIVNRDIFVVKVHHDEEISTGFHQGMGYLIPTTRWIASTAHIMHHVENPSEHFFRIIDGEEVGTDKERATVKTISPARGIDVSRIETVDETSSQLEFGNATVGNRVVLFHAVLTERPCKIILAQRVPS